MRYFILLFISLAFFGCASDDTASTDNDRADTGANYDVTDDNYTASTGNSDVTTDNKVASGKKTTTKKAADIDYNVECNVYISQYEMLADEVKNSAASFEKLDKKTDETMKDFTERAHNIDNKLDGTDSTRVNSSCWQRYKLAKENYARAMQALMDKTLDH